MHLWTVTGSPQTNDSERGITMKKIGAITVGQSPRVDLIPEIQPILGDSVEIIQRHSENPTFFPACSFALTISNSRVFP